MFLLVSGATLICVAAKPDLALLGYPILLGNALGAGLISAFGCNGSRSALETARDVSDVTYRSAGLVRPCWAVGLE